MFRATVFAGLLLGVVFAGCIGEPTGPAAGKDLAAPPVRFTLGGVESTGEVVFFEGGRLLGEEASITNSFPPFVPRPPRPACTAENCETVPLEIHDAVGQRLAIGIEWEGQDETWSARDGPGYYLGDAAVHLDVVVRLDGEIVLDVKETSHYGGASLLDAPSPGTYEIEVVAARGHSSYYLVVGLEEAAQQGSQADAVELFPDLVAFPADHPTFEVPIGHELGTRRIALAGCGPDEVAEDQDRRCLRFAGIIGNQGPGAFFTVLEFDAAERAVLGQEAQWEQVIRASDGSERREPIGAAHYHAVHGHFHILDFVATRLYAYDLEHGERGDPVGEGRKMGFCIIDGGIIDLFAPLVPPAYDGSGCCYIAGICQLDRATHDRFQMGISPNWYDIYPWWRSDQYVEVTGLADGVYELVSVINPDGLILETDPDNNEASTVLRIRGDTVEVLSMRTDASLGPHPDADWGYAAQETDDETG